MSELSEIAKRGKRNSEKLALEVKRLGVASAGLCRSIRDFGHAVGMNDLLTKCHQLGISDDLIEEARAKAATSCWGIEDLLAELIHKTQRGE